MAKRSHARRSNQYDMDNGGFQATKKGRGKSARKQRKDEGNIVEMKSRSQQLETAYSPQRTSQPLQARTSAQQDYIDAIKQHSLTFGIGPAGTGKSYCAGALAAEALESGRIERIILTRPAVEAGEQLGFLPGALDEKFSVYIDAFRDILNERLGAGTVDYCLRHGRIVAAPLAFMRGKTFNNRTFVVLDEAQNTSMAQMKMFLTRIGEDCKVVINGDIEQSDIKGANGLADAIDKLSGVNSVHVHRFERDDIVRSGLVRDIIDRYELS
ncbi:PhoH family protein [Gilvimarinus sp. SDUM040013]|uniref:PhoH family protein n=1 Tax=Gilvimarinus gilvus TaxID=3058038 RepID=A0ABU4S230_9GAMM|nr:PhoH family protein [Gilvimarinus sp. SDUM040013]MDO3384357.1 PhoH family protein [Gilvimarinus sp. SDUM040013]MDX6851205.1 PhoH family protein [Gilvimarinus sp. SDUM040013]